MEQKILLGRKIEALQETLSYIDTKLAFYEDVVHGRAEYVSNLIPDTEAR